MDLLHVTLLPIDFEDLLVGDETLFESRPQDGGSRLGCTGRYSLGFFEVAPDNLQAAVQIGLRDCANQGFPAARESPLFFFSDREHFSVPIRVRAKQTVDDANGFVV